MAFRIWASALALAGLAAAGAARAEFAADFYADTDEPHGTVVSWARGAANDIHAARVYSINGHNVPGERRALFLKPGEYELKFRIIGRDKLPTARSVINRREPEGYNTLTLNVEAGKRYYVGAKLNRKTTDYPWSIVLWKVESEDDAEADGDR